MNYAKLAKWAMSWSDSGIAGLTTIPKSGGLEAATRDCPQTEAFTARKLVRTVVREDE
jgi:hypothetical protein